MKVLEHHLNLEIRKLKITKIKTTVTVPQKTLNKLKDRIENARETLVVEDKSSFNNILLIDDAVGSGATLNETAKKIKENSICKSDIIGLKLKPLTKRGFFIVIKVNCFCWSI